ncbi:hypothetical protein COCNU_05G005030 [Cocos nucifera]|uniref:Uncharacterized protein n=1 Tax=Cocos nucifera TaxID=13894 RepID=A0A8K0I8U5_COCNU|nr:hypothetical protein COCNU_05G005030 [Cocos nucifera]
MEHIHSTMDSTPTVSSAGSTSMGGQRKRGCTRGVGLSKINKTLGKKMKINISAKEGRPRNVVQSTKLPNEQKLDVKGLRTDEEVCDSVKKLLSFKSKDLRCRIYIHYFNHGKNSKTSTVTTTSWMDLCTYWNKDET